MERPANHRRRAVAGLLLGSAVALGAAWGWLLLARRAESDRAADQRALCEVRALAELLERAVASGASPATVVGQWAARSPELELVRVVSLEDRLLAASTVREDQTGGVTPRKLRREEKPLFDAADELRRGAENNQAADGPRKESVKLERLDQARRLVWAPILLEGRVTGAVQAQIQPRETGRPDHRGGTALAVALAPAALLLLLGMAIGQRRALLTVVGGVLLAGVVGWQAWRFAGELSSDRLAHEQRLAADLAGQAERFAAVAQASGFSLDGEALDPARWDADRNGTPRGVVLAEGGVAADRLAESARGVARRGALVHAAFGLVGLGLLAFVALGTAARGWQTLVRYRVAYAYVTPAMVGMLLLVFFPFVYGITLSFTNSNIYNSDKPISEIWTGLDNFRDILSDFAIMRTTEDGGAGGLNYKNFYYTLGFTVIWTVANVGLGVSLGLLLALILNTKGLRLKPLYRVLLVLPWAVPNYITALIWKGMFHQQFGVVNQVIQIFGGAPVSWFEKPVTSFVTVLATNGWLSFPFMMVIALGALQSIPADLYEAARVDGASRWQQFRSITLPSLKPALVPAVILSVIWTFNMFNIIYLVSQGEPAGSTEILITQAYKLAFEQYRYGYAAAYSTVIFFILFAYGTWQNRVTRATEGI